MCVCARVRAYVCMCMCVCVRVCVCAREGLRWALVSHVAVCLCRGPMVLTPMVLIPDTEWKGMEGMEMEGIEQPCPCIPAGPTGTVNYFQCSSFYSGNGNALWKCTENHTMQSLQAIALSRTTGSVRNLPPSMVIQRACTVCSRACTIYIYV